MNINEKKKDLIKIYNQMAITNDISVYSLYDALFSFSYIYLNTNIVANRTLTYETSKFYISIINKIIESIFYKNNTAKTIREVERIISYITDISKYSNIKDIPSYDDSYRIDPEAIKTRKEILLEPIKNIKEINL